jgi:hypothetical protein
VSALELLSSLGISVIWMGGWAQLIGMPIAWLRLRGTGSWEERPEGVRRIDLLAAHLARPTAAAVVWGWLVIIAAALGGLGLSGGALAAIMFGAPLVFVPWAVLQLDREGLGTLRPRR